jgi:hypothetical protein
MKPQLETLMTIHNKAPFESQLESPVPPPHLDRPVRGGKLENDQRSEGRIELLRRKAAFAFRLAAIHAPRTADREAPGFSSHQRHVGTKRNNPDAGNQTTSR